MQSVHTGSEGPLAPLLTVPEAAQHLKLSVRNVRQLIADGLLPAARIGARVRVRPADLCRFVDDRVATPAENTAPADTAPPDDPPGQDERRPATPLVHFTRAP
jgi:excisionase family DNA binding protein